MVWKIFLSRAVVLCEAQTPNEALLMQPPNEVNIKQHHCRIFHRFTTFTGLVCRESFDSGCLLVLGSICVKTSSIIVGLFSNIYEKKLVPGNVSLLIKMIDRGCEHQTAFAHGIFASEIKTKYTSHAMFKNNSLSLAIL